MAQTPEAKVKAKITKVLREEGVYYFFPATGGYGRSGVPDIVCCVGGAFLGIELEAIRRAGGVAIVANEENWDMVRAVVRELSLKEVV